MCDSYCPTKIYLKDGKAVSTDLLDARVKDLCPRWRAQIDFVYHPKRLRCARAWDNSKYYLVWYYHILRLISPGFLKAVRKKAMRKRVWYNSIDGLERGIVNLTICLVENIESLTLLNVLKNILNKIKESSKSVFIRYYETYGLSKAEKVVKLAVGFGCEYATTWLNYSSFSRLLTLNDWYDPSGRR